MAWSKTGWTDIVGASDSLVVLAAAGSTSGSIDCGGANPLVSLDVQVYLSSSTAASTLTVQFYGYDHRSSSLSDNVSLFEAAIEGESSASKKTTYALNVASKDGVVVKLTNDDDGDSASVWAAWMGGYV